MGEPDQATRSTTSRSGLTRMEPWVRWVRLGALGVIVVSTLLAVRVLPVGRVIGGLVEVVDQLGVWGLLLFGLAYVVAAVLFVPGSALTLAAGAVFGLWWGTLTVWFAATAAAAVAFLVSRHVARDTVKGWAARSPRFSAIDRAIGDGGWRIIALLRLSPAVPFSLGNYLFGLTAIGFWPYVVASWIFMLPGTFMYVYLGYAGSAGLAAAAGAGGGRTLGEWVLLAIGLAATVAVTIYVTRLASRAIREQGALDQRSDAPVREAPPARAVGGRRSALALAVVAVLVVAGTGWLHANRARVAGLFGPPPVEMREAFAQRPDGPSVDHSGFGALLARHVDDRGMVDYRGLDDDASELGAYLEMVAAAPLDALGRDERLALLINAYNAFTLRLILDHYPVASIQDIPANQRWDGRTWSIGGRAWTLNQIEHEQIRPKFAEPRIHWALVCAAIGCPPLRSEAYAAGRLGEQLAEQAAIVHGSDRWFRYDAERGAVRLTSLYDWYAGDFEQAAGSVLAYAARYVPRLKAALDAGRAPRIEFLDYDWSLNEQKRGS